MTAENFKPILANFKNKKIKKNNTHSLINFNID